MFSEYGLTISHCIRVCNLGVVFACNVIGSVQECFIFCENK